MKSRAHHGKIKFISVRYDANMNDLSSDDLYIVKVYWKKELFVIGQRGSNHEDDDDRKK